MRAIWKYPIGLSIEPVVHSMPEGAQILTVQVQQDVITLWAMVDPDQPRTDRRFVVWGTGHRHSDAEKLTYIGSVQMGPFVWHIFEERP